MARVLIIDGRDSVARILVTTLGESASVELCLRAPRREAGPGGYSELFAARGVDTVVYSPPLRTDKQSPDLGDAAALFQDCADFGIKKVVVLSSAAIYGASPRNPGLMSESRTPSRNGTNPIGGQWAEFERIALRYLGVRTSGSQSFGPWPSPYAMARTISAAYLKIGLR